MPVRMAFVLPALRTARQVSFEYWLIILILRCLCLWYANCWSACCWSGDVGRMRNQKGYFVGPFEPGQPLTGIAMGVVKKSKSQDVPEGWVKHQSILIIQSTSTFWALPAQSCPRMEHQTFRHVQLPGFLHQLWFAGVISDKQRIMFIITLFQLLPIHHTSMIIRGEAHLWNSALCLSYCAWKLPDNNNSY